MHTSPRCSSVFTSKRRYVFCSHVFEFGVEKSKEMSDVLMKARLELSTLPVKLTSRPFTPLSKPAPSLTHEWMLRSYTPRCAYVFSSMMSSRHGNNGCPTPGKTLWNAKSQSDDKIIPEHHVHQHKAYLSRVIHTASEVFHSKRSQFRKPLKIRFAERV